MGEFDQKGSVRTKYGTKDEYVKAIKTAKEAGINIYADIVLNHKLGGDKEEEADARPYNPDNRNHPIGDLQKVKVWTHFTFPGRKGRYSSLEWHWWHFDAVDYNVYDGNTKAIYVLKDKAFDQDVDLEKGSFAYLMGCDLDMQHPEVRGELNYWGEWYIDTSGIDGFRFDAVKHIKAGFFPEWLNHLRQLAYALILLRSGGYPCIFYADYYGAHYKDKGRDGQEYEIWIDKHQWIINKLLFARKEYAFGNQYDYFDHANTIGWTRLGTEEHPGGMAVVLSNGEDGTKWMEIGQPNQAYIDLTEHIKEPVVTNDQGWADFRCLAGSVSVWIPKK